MGHMHKLTLQPVYNSVAAQETFCGLWWRDGNCLKISRQDPNLADLLAGAKQKIFIVAIESGQSAHNIACVGAHAELVHSADVDRNSHTKILITGRASTHSRQRNHSSLSRIIGSTLKARLAGIHVAIKPRSAIAKTTPVRTTGSLGVA